MSAPKGTRKAVVNVQLEKFLNGELRKMQKVGADYSPTQKMAIVDRLIKIEAIRAKMTDDDFGSGFKKD